MIKKVIVLAVSVVVLLSANIPLLAQQQVQQSEDQKIEALKKRQLELKRQLIEELEKENKAIEEELNRKRLGSVQPKTPAPAPQPVAGQNDMVIPASLSGRTQRIPAMATGMATQLVQLRRPSTRLFRRILPL